MKNDTCCGHPVHEAAALFPLLPEAELKELAEDIKANGLIYPVIMCDDKILDGRNRLLACEAIGMGVRFRDYRTYKSNHTATEWVMAANSKRRQLTASQKGAIASEAKPLIAKEIAAEKASRIAESNRNPMAEKIPPSKKPAREARTRAAKAMGVNPRYVDDAERIKGKSVDVFEQVKAGNKTISAAKKELGLEPPRQEPDYPAIIRAAWLKCTKQQQKDLLAWQAKHKK